MDLENEGQAKAGDRDYKVGMRKFIGVTDTFSVLILVMVSWMYAHVKIYQSICFRMCSLSYAHHMSIKLRMRQRGVRVTKSQERTMRRKE